MLLTEQHIINHKNPLFNQCDNLCFLSKNLYNAGLYHINKEYSLTKKYINYHELNKLFIETNNHDYRQLPAKVAQQTLMLLDRNFKAYFKALNDYKKNPSKYKGLPKPPSFKHKSKGRFVITYTNQTFSKILFKKTGELALTKTSIHIKTKIKDYQSIQQVRIIPTLNNEYKIEVIYDKPELPKVVDNNIYCGIDVGLNNLFAVAFNNKDIENILVTGRPLKSINQYYNKEKAKIQSELQVKNKVKHSKKLNKLRKKRNNKIRDYVHKVTKKLVNTLKQTNVSKVIIGKNDNWKSGINIGDKNNQNFVSIPHANIINILTYKLGLIGIGVICREESYTSKCSSIDYESIKKQDRYVGYRVKRGLFRSEKGILINADINGAANILRKEIPRAYADGIEGLVVNPIQL